MINEEILKQHGFKPEVFFYQIGGGEDEDDTIIFVRDEIVVFWDRWSKCWRKTKRSNINYVSGLPDEAEVFTEMEL